MHPRPTSRWTRRRLRWLCGVVVAAILPLLAGCSPELLIGGAIAGSVLYAHVNKDNLPARRWPTPSEPRSYYANSAMTPRAYTASRPSASRIQSPSNEQAGTISPIVEGGRAYWDLRWQDAVRILNQAIETGSCTEPELGQAHILLGAMAYQQGDAEAARGHFIQAQKHDPRLQPSPQLFPPPMVDFYKNARGP